MSERAPVVPRGALLGTLALLAGAVAAVALANPPSSRASTAVAESLALTIEEREGGGLEMRGPRERVIDRLVVEGDSFAITALRGVAGHLSAEPGGPAWPVVLRETTEGSLQLLDPRTGRILTLEGFGDDNRAVFARYLHAAPGPDARP